MPQRKSPQTLTQGKLNFGSTKPKRTTTQNVKPKQTKILAGPKRTVESNDESSDIEEIETLYSSGDESTSASRKNQDVEAPKKALSTFKATRRTVASSATPAQKVVENEGAPKLNENDSKFNAHYATVRQKMNYMPPIHSDGQSKVHEILRCFDMSYEFGPCVGVSRLERWERAQLMGLNPPKEVKDILTTKQGLEQREFSQSVLFNEV